MLISQHYMQTLLLKKHLLLQKGTQNLYYSCYSVSVETVCWSGIGKTGGGGREGEVKWFWLKSSWPVTVSARVTQRSKLSMLKSRQFSSLRLLTCSKGGVWFSRNHSESGCSSNLSGFFPDFLLILNTYRFFSATRILINQ